MLRNYINIRDFNYLNLYYNHMKPYLYLSNDPKFEHSFYNMYNPKLWQAVEENKRVNDKLRKAIGENYEIRENGVASLGNYLDEANKAGEEEIKRDKDQKEKDKQAKYNDALALGKLPA